MEQNIARDQAALSDQNRDRAVKRELSAAADQITLDKEKASQAAAFKQSQPDLYQEYLTTLQSTLGDTLPTLTQDRLDRMVMKAAESSGYRPPMVTAEKKAGETERVGRLTRRAADAIRVAELKTLPGIKYVDDQQLLSWYASQSDDEPIKRDIESRVRKATETTGLPAQELPMSRGVVGEVGSALVRGVAGMSALPEAAFRMSLQPGEEYAPMLSENRRAIQQDFRASTDLNRLQRAAVGGVESMPQLLAQIAASAVTGGGATAFALTAAGPVAAQSYNDAYELVVANGGSPQQAHYSATLKGLTDATVTAITSKMEFSPFRGNQVMEGALRKHFARRVGEALARGTTAEGLQEAVEQAGQEATDAFVRAANSIEPIPFEQRFNNVIDAMLAGAFAGGGVNVATMGGQPPQQPPAAPQRTFTPVQPQAPKQPSRFTPIPQPTPAPQPAATPVPPKQPVVTEPATGPSTAPDEYVPAEIDTDIDQRRQAGSQQRFETQQPGFMREGEYVQGEVEPAPMPRPQGSEAQRPGFMREAPPNEPARPTDEIRPVETGERQPAPSEGERGGVAQPGGTPAVEPALSPVVGDQGEQSGTESRNVGGVEETTDEPLRQYADPQATVEAVHAMFAKGKKVYVRTALRTTPLSKPEHIRVKNGKVQIPRGRNWDTLLPEQVNDIANQAGLRPTATQPAPVESKASPTPTVKESSKVEPWQMTLSELNDVLRPANKEELERARPILKALFPPDDPRISANEIDDPWGIYRAITRGDQIPRPPVVDLSVRHRAAISAAIKAGKTVPPEVLAEYPDIAKPKDGDEGAGGLFAAPSPKSPAAPNAEPAPVEPTAEEPSKPKTVADKLEAYAKKQKKKANEGGTLLSGFPVDRAWYMASGFAADALAKGIRTVQAIMAHVRNALADVKMAIKDRDAALTRLETMLNKVATDGEVDAEKFMETSDKETDKSVEAEIDNSIYRSKDEESPKNMQSGRNVDFNRDRAKFGRKELDSPDRRSQESLVEKAISEWSTERTDTMIREVGETGRQMTDQEIAAVVVRLVELSNDYDALIKRAAAAVTSKNKAELAYAQAEMKRIEDLHEFITATTAASKREVARALAAAKITLTDEYDLVTVLNRARIRKGGELTAEERAKYQQQVNDLQAKNADIEDSLKQLRRSEAEATIQSIRRDAKTGRKTKDASGDALLKRVRDLIEKGGCR